MDGWMARKYFLRKKLFLPLFTFPCLKTTFLFSRVCYCFREEKGGDESNFAPGICVGFDNMASSDYLSDECGHVLLTGSVDDDPGSLVVGDHLHSRR